MASQDRPRAVGLSRLFSVAWVMSTAFAKNRVQAVSAMPWALLTVIPFMLRRTVYQSNDRNGVVFFGPHRPGLDVGLALAMALVISPLMVLVPSLFVTLVMTLAFTGATSPAQVIAIIIVGVLLCSSVYGAAAFLRGATLDGITGPETPPGERYAVMSLAQRPRTRISALLLARALISSLPSGKVLVSRAASEKIAVGYEHLGFTRGNGLRVFLVSK